MGWVVLLLLLIGFPLMLVFAALSLSLWLVWAVLGLVWAVLTFIFHDPATALLIVAALFIGYRYGRRRQDGDTRDGRLPRGH